MLSLIFLSMLCLSVLDYQESKKTILIPSLTWRHSSINVWTKVYGVTIFSQLNGQILKNILKTGHNDRYELVFAVDANGKYHVPTIDDASNGDGIPLESM